MEDDDPTSQEVNIPMGEPSTRPCLAIVPFAARPPVAEFGPLRESRPTTAEPADPDSEVFDRDANKGKAPAESPPNSPTRSEDLEDDHPDAPLWRYEKYTIEQIEACVDSLSRLPKLYLNLVGRTNAQFKQSEGRLRELLAVADQELQDARVRNKELESTLLEQTRRIQQLEADILEKERVWQDERDRLHQQVESAQAEARTAAVRQRQLASTPNHRVVAAEQALTELANLRIEVEALRSNPSARTRQTIRAYLQGRKEDIGKYLLGFQEDLAAAERRLDRMIRAHPDTPYWSDTESESADEEQPGPSNRSPK